MAGCAAKTHLCYGADLVNRQNFGVTFRNDATVITRMPYSQSLSAGQVLSRFDSLPATMRRPSTRCRISNPSPSEKSSFGSTHSQQRFDGHQPDAVLSILLRREVLIWFDSLSATIRRSSVRCRPLTTTSTDKSLLDPHAMFLRSLAPIPRPHPSP